MNPDRKTSNLREHFRPVLSLGFVSGLGILATAAFQIYTSRSLGPDAFGLLSAFLAIVSIAANGAAALQNSVAVTIAQHEKITSTRPPKWRLDSTWLEAISLGGAGTFVVIVLSAPLSGFLDTSSLAVVIAALVIAPNFLFSRAQGVFQGVGKTLEVVWWTTGLMIARFLVAIALITSGLGVVAVLFAILGLTLTVTIITSKRSALLAPPVHKRPFTSTVLVVIFLTLLFALLTNIDTVLVRGTASEDISGNYAAAAIFAKFVLIAPMILSIYLLPKFVHSTKDKGKTARAVNVTLLLVGGAGLLLSLALFAGGPILSQFILGSQYESAASIMGWLCLAYVPWAMAQTLLIRLTASASKSALLTMTVIAAIQIPVGLAILPDLTGYILLTGVLGSGLLVAMVLIHLYSSRIGVGRNA